MDDQHQPRNQVVDHDELEGLLPYLDLARQIRSEVDRFVADEADDLDSLADALAAIPDRQRATIARDVFDRLPADLQWALLERAFPDDELRDLLDAERARRLEVARRDAATADLVARRRSDRSTRHSACCRRAPPSRSVCSERST